MKKLYITNILILLAVFCHAQNNCLVAHYPFTGNANDASGNGFNGVNNGAALTTDRFGNANQAYSFDGVSAYIDIANFDTLKSYSILAWVKDNVTTGEGRVFSNGCFGCFGGSVDFGCYYDSTHNAPFVVNQTGATQSSFHGSALIDTNWNHIVVTYNDTTKIQTVYVNGVLSGGTYDPCCGWQTSPVSPNQTPVYNYRIGCNGGGSTYQFFYGKIDDIYVYGCALRQAGVDSIYHENGWASVNQVPAAGGISIYPNPANEIVTVSFNHIIPGSSVKIVNTLGKVVYSSTVKNQKQEISLSSQAAGVYFVQVTGNFKTVTQKFVKE